MIFSSRLSWKHRLLIAAACMVVMAWSRYQKKVALQRSLAGVPTTYTAPATLPPLGPARRLAAGILWHEVTLARGSMTSKLWIYLPEHPVTPTLPCVFIAPAGTHLYEGMRLSTGDQPEHLPYVRAGFAVVAYELDGSLPAQGHRSKDIYIAAQTFKSADAGVDNARTAIDYAFARIPNLDHNRIYTAGHSSAGTVSLLVAEHEPRIKACLAYAPVPDVERRLGHRFIQAVAQGIPDYPEFIARSSPINGVTQLRCPVFLFHADDDSNLPTSQVADFAAQLQKTNAHVTFSRVPTGNHYNSMIQQGIPQGIAWLQHLPPA